MISDLINQETSDLLEAECDFVLGAHPSSLEMLPESSDLIPIAGDGSGGCFYEWAAQASNGVAPVVFLSCYGEAARFADSISEALTIVVAYSGYWTDALVAAHKGEDVLAHVVKNHERDFDSSARQARERLRGLLSLDLSRASEMLMAAVRRRPPFAPLLRTVDGETPCESFADRPFPR